MTAIQKAKLLMVKGLVTFLDENAAIVALIVAFQTAVTALKAKIVEIDDTAELSSLSITGITTEKRSFKENVCQLTVDLTGLIYAYAVDTANQPLKQEVKLAPSTLRRKSDSELVRICQAIRDRAVENKDALKGYGVTDALLTELQTAIDNYAAASPKPRTAIGKRKTRREILQQLFREMDEILNERMDSLMGGFRAAHPEFYQTYFNLREVVDPSSTATQLKGAITDAATGNPIKSATVTVVQLNKTAVTDSAGEYAFKPIENGRFTVRVTAEGYQPYENDEIMVIMGNIRTLNVGLVSN